MKTAEMKAAALPHLVVHRSGKAFKVLQVTGLPGMSMPEHFCTKEAVLVIQRGAAVLHMKGKEYPLKQHDSFIIPEGEKHTLSILEDFQSNVIMELAGEIKFA